MNRLSTASIIAFALLIVCGCGDVRLGDPTIYGTQLPNGLQHVSNGGEQGWIGKPFTEGKSWDLVYPRTHEWSCNEFAILGDDVIGIEIQYAKRAFVDPPVATRW